MKLLLKKHLPTLIFLVCVTVISTIVGVVSRPYFTEPVFYLDQHKYTLHKQQGDRATYQSKTADQVTVIIGPRKHTVHINNQSYVITQIASTPVPIYHVTYPNGHKYTVKQQSEQLLSYDEKGKMLAPFTLVVDGHRVLEDDEELYTPTMLVIAAYPEFHHMLGTPALLLLALAMLIFGWCSFYYQRFQDMLFWLSLRWIWVTDPEPSDFYYFMCKVNGVIFLMVAIWVTFQAF